MNTKEIVNTRRRLLSKFKGLKFDEESHTYTLNGKQLVSSSEFLKRYVRPFNTWVVATALAKKYNTSNGVCRKRDPSYYIQRWNELSTAAKYSGAKVHRYIEYNYPDFHDAPDCNQELGAIEFFKNLDHDKYEVLAMELRMYIRKYFRGGTTDMVLLNKETGKLVVADWKTGQKNINQYYSGNKLKEPFNHLYNTNLNKYTLQLCDYQNMIEISTDFEVEDRWIIHLDDKDWNELDLSKRNKSDKYNIDSSYPDEVGVNYRLYKLNDYTKELKEEYKKFIEEHKYYKNTKLSK